MEKVTLATDTAAQVCANKPAKFMNLGATTNCVARRPALLPRSTGAGCWPNLQRFQTAFIWFCHCTTSPPHRSGSRCGGFKAEAMEAILYGVGLVETHRDPSHRTADSSPPRLWSDGRENPRRLPRAFIRRRTGQGLL